MSDVMLLGVLRMPIPDNPDPMTLRQFVDRARQAADRIEADTAEIERLRAVLDQRVIPLLEATVAAERERCAKLCESLAGGGWIDAAQTCANAIRDLGPNFELTGLGRERQR